MAFPFWNTAVYNLFSRFSKDVATRRAASLSASTPFPSGFYNAAARRIVFRLHASHLWGPMVSIAPRHATSLQTPPRLPTLPPTCALPSPYLGRCTLGFHAKIRGCSGPGRAMVGRRYGGIRGNGWGHTGLHGLRIWWGSAFVATWRAASRLIITASQLITTALIELGLRGAFQRFA